MLRGNLQICSFAYKLKRIVHVFYCMLLFWKDNNLKEMGINTRNWVDSTQDRDYCISLVNAALNHRVP